MGGMAAEERPLQRKDSGIESNAQVSGARQGIRRDEQVAERTYDGFALKELSASGRYLSTSIKFRQISDEERAANQAFTHGRVFVSESHIHYEVTYRPQVKFIKADASEQGQAASTAHAKTHDSADGFSPGPQRSPTIRLGKRRRSHDDPPTTQSNGPPPREGFQQQSRNASVHLLRREGSASTRRSEEAKRREPVQTKRIRLRC